MSSTKGRSVSSSVHPERSAVQVLAFAPHPDDAELYCGGMLARLAESGYRVGIVDMTRGELGSQGTPEERSTEAAQASIELGLSHRENLHLPDGGLDPLGMIALPDGTAVTQREIVAECIRRLRPEIVLAPYWEDRHPDHRNGSLLVRDGLFFAGASRFVTKVSARGSGAATVHAVVQPAPHQPRQLLFYPFRTEGKLSFITDISAVKEKKLRAIRAYRSQIERASERAVDTLISSPLTVSSIEARDGYYGGMIGTAAGEGFIALNHLRIDDPVSFFAASAATQPLFFPHG